MKLKTLSLFFGLVMTLRAQVPTPAQGRDYGANVNRIIAVDANGDIIVSGSSPSSGCPGSVITPCVVVGPVTENNTASGAPVRIAGEDGAPGILRTLKVDASGQLIPANAAVAGADAVSNTTQNLTGAAGATIYMRSLGYLFNGATWDRWRGSSLGGAFVQGGGAAGAALVGNPNLIGGTDGANLRALLTDTSGRQVAVGGAAAGAAVAGAPVLIGGKDGSGNAESIVTDVNGRIDPAAVSTALADALSNTANLPSLGAAAGTVRNLPFAYNNSTWDRVRSTSAGNETAAINTGAVLGEKGPRWSVTSAPGAGNQATASKAAGGAGVRHVVDCIAYSALAGVAPALTGTTVSLRDGATGAGTVLWQYAAEFPAATGESVPPQHLCGLNLVGSSATAMTFEFSAGVANASQAVNISGYDVN